MVKNLIYILFFGLILSSCAIHQSNPGKARYTKHQGRKLLVVKSDRELGETPLSDEKSEVSVPSLSIRQKQNTLDLIDVLINVLGVTIFLGIITLFVLSIVFNWSIGLIILLGFFSLIVIAVVWFGIAVKVN